MLKNFISQRCGFLIISDFRVTELLSLMFLFSDCELQPCTIGQHTYKILQLVVLSPHEFRHKDIWQIQPNPLFLLFVSSSGKHT